MSSSQLTNSLHHFFGQSWGTVTVNIWVEEGGISPTNRSYFFHDSEISKKYGFIILQYITMVYDTCNSSIHRAYKPTFTSLGGLTLYPLPVFSKQRGSPLKNKGNPLKNHWLISTFPFLLLSLSFL